MSEAAERYTEQPHFSLRVAVLAKLRQKHCENVCIKLDWISQCFRSSVGIKAGVANRQRKGPRGQPRLTQPFARLLRQMAEQRLHFGDIIGIFTKGVILRN